MGRTKMKTVDKKTKTCLSVNNSAINKLKFLKIQNRSELVNWLLEKYLK